MTVIFIGQSDFHSAKYEELEDVIRCLIEQGATEFVSGGMGNFDWIAAKAVYTLKHKYPHIQNNLVIPYLTFKIQEKSYFDSIIYPQDFEKYHFKAAIPARNRYMVNHAQVAVCYVNHDWGGAAKTYAYAIKKGLKIINLGTSTTAL